VPIVVLGTEAMPSLRRVRVIYNWLNYLNDKKIESWTGDELQKELDFFLSNTSTGNLYARILQTIASVFYGETGGGKQLVEDIRFFFTEIWMRFVFRRRTKRKAWSLTTS
jgi:hypothetical protein